MVKEAGKERDRTRSKAGVTGGATRTTRGEESRRMSKESEVKVETRNKPASSSSAGSSTTTPKSESSSSAGSSKSSAVASKDLVVAKGAAAAEMNPPVILDKKEIYETVLKSEAHLAATTSMDEDSEEFLMTSEDFQQVMKEIIDLKNSGTPNEEEMDLLKMEGLLLLNKFRHLNRIAKLRLKLVKDEAMSRRHDVDRNHLLLQNLLYEATHLKKQVEAVQEYKGQDEEIDLIPVEDFYKTAPPEISKPELTKCNDHYLRIARLEHEFILRQELTNKCSDLEKKMDEVATDIEGSRKKLDGIKPLLHAVLESTKPVQDFFGVNVWNEQKKLQTAYHLPIPLYCLFIQSSAYKNNLESSGCQFITSISGDVEAAKEYIEDSIEDEPEEKEEEESDSDLEGDDVDDNDNADADVSDRRKSRKGSTAQTSKVSPRKKLTQMHPLSVEWIFKIPSGETLQITFSYASKLQIVTVKAKLESGVFSDRVPALLRQADSILPNLFPQDTGLECPNPANFYHLRKADVENFSELVGEIGRAYSWAQKVSGLAFPQQVQSKLDSMAAKTSGRQLRPDAKLCSLNIEKTVQKLFDRVRNQTKLWGQIKAIESRNLAIPVEVREMFPKKILTSFTSWEYVPNGQSHTMVSKLLSRNKVTVDPEVKDMYFLAVVERGRVKLHALIVVSLDFPKTTPTFYLLLMKDGQEVDQSVDCSVRDMEKEINFHGPEDFGQWPEVLLVLQIQRMMACLDIFLETDMLVGEASGPSEFGRDKLFSSPARGRNNRRPFEYASAGGQFHQRF